MTESKVAPSKKAGKSKDTSTEKATSKDKTVVKKATANKKTTSTKSAVKKTKVSNEDLALRYRMIEVSAYLIAEKDGFASNPIDYWLAAEAEINQSDT